MNGGASGRPHREAFIHMNTQFLLTGGFIMHFCRLGNSPSAFQRGFYEATAGECDEPEYTMA